MYLILKHVQTSASINFRNADHIDFHGCSQGSRAGEVNPVEQ